MSCGNKKTRGGGSLKNTEEIGKIIPTFAEFREADLPQGRCG